MNLLERIELRLDDTRYRIQQLDFEDCATSLIGLEYPGLAPVTGGTDHGLDAELVKPNGQVLGLIVTSSRTWEGAKRSLRGSLQSARDHEREVHQVMVANLAEINRQKRVKLSEIAKKFDCELVQVYDRSWFANTFIANPDWRQKILHISGGAFSLSRTPRGARPDEHQLPTVGRDDLIADASGSPKDLVLWGVPGAGKSHVAGRLPGALFLAQGTSPERLLDDLLSTNPALVVVDDAGSRADDIGHLLHARQAENLGFRVVATCWPHEKEAVGDHLPGAKVLEVDLLSREEIGTLLRDRGISRLSIIVNLLEQSRGRPAWALNLADLLVGQGNWRSVWTGQALREQINAFLRRSNAPAEAIHLLAAIALVGEANEDQARIIARLFQLAPVQFDQLIRSVAIAGLIDVERRRVWNAGPNDPTFEDCYRVVPRQIAASIVADVFFDGRATPVRVGDLKMALPDLTAGIVQTQIHAALLGAAEPLLPSAEEMKEILSATASAFEDKELLRSHALISPEHARFVVEYLTGAVQAAVSSGDATSAVGATNHLAERTAEAFANEDSSSAGAMFEAFATLASCGWDYKSSIKSLVEDLRDARTGDAPDSVAILCLARELGGELSAALPDAVWLELVAEMLKPTFDGNYMSPERPNEFVLQSFTWPAAAIDTMFSAVEPGLAARIGRAAPANLDQFIDLIDKWSQIANGYDVAFSGRPTDAQEESGRRVALALAQHVAARTEGPGLRARLNKAARTVGFTLSEPDPLFAALTREREIAEDWEAARQRFEDDLDAALNEYAEHPPEVLMAWLAHHDADLSAVKNGYPGYQVLQRVAARMDPEPWLASAIDHGLGRMASPLISKCLDRGTIDASMTARLLNDPGARSHLIAGVIGGGGDEETLALVLKDLRLDDVAGLESNYVMYHAPANTRSALFTHPDPLVRGTTAALWAAEVSISSDSIPDDPDWAGAMAEFVVPSEIVRDYMQTKALEVFAIEEPEAFADLLVTHVERLTGSDDFDEWEEGVAKLSVANRIRLWERVSGSPMARNLFWVISAGDVEWIAATVADPAFPVPLSRLLHSPRFQHGKRYPLKTLAIMLRPLNWRPDDLLWTLEVGTYWGEEHEQIARNLQTCKELAESSDADLERLGARGVEILEPRLAKAKAAARRAAVRGNLY